PLRPTRAQSQATPSASPRRPAPVAGGAAGLLPFQLVDNLIVVDAVLNRKASVTLLLDTGATETMLTPETATRVGLRPLADPPKRAARLADAPLPGVPVVPLSALSVGEASVENLLVGVAVFSPQGLAVDGLLG